MIKLPSLQPEKDVHHADRNLWIILNIEHKEDPDQS